MAKAPHPSPTEPERPAASPAEAAPTAVQPAPAQVQPPGVVPLTTPGRVLRRYATVSAENIITRIEEADAPPKAGEGERVVDVHSVPAFVGNVVDAVGNVSVVNAVTPPSAQAIVPEVTPATVPAAPLSGVPLPQTPATGT